MELIVMDQQPGTTTHDVSGIRRGMDVRRL